MAGTVRLRPSVLHARLTLGHNRDVPPNEKYPARKLLGHKKTENTMKYTQLIQFKDSEYEVTAATTMEEAKAVLAGGFEHVTEKDGCMLFRKSKRFVSVEMCKCST